MDVLRYEKKKNERKSYKNDVAHDVSFIIVYGESANISAMSVLTM